MYLIFLCDTKKPKLQCEVCVQHPQLCDIVIYSFINVYSLNTIKYILQFNYVHVLHQLMMNSIGYKLEITPKNCIMRKRQFSMLKRSLNPLFIQTISLTIEIHS